MRVLTLGLGLGCEREAMEGDVGQVQCFSGFVIARRSADWLTHRGLVHCSSPKLLLVKTRS
jgi:hypothetical protein